MYYSVFEVKSLHTVSVKLILDPISHCIEMADESKKVKIRPKSLFNFKLPKIVFGGVSPSVQEHSSHYISAPTDFQRGASIGVDKETGKLDLSSVPHEFRELVQKLYENISQQKVIQTDEIVENSLMTPEDEVVQKRKGPTVQKGLKEEDILKEMRSLVTLGDPWKKYKHVRIVLQFIILL